VARHLWPRYVIGGSALLVSAKLHLM